MTTRAMTVRDAEERLREAEQAIQKPPRDGEWFGWLCYDTALGVWLHESRCTDRTDAKELARYLSAHWEIPCGTVYLPDPTHPSRRGYAPGWYGYAPGDARLGLITALRRFIAEERAKESRNSSAQTAGACMVENDDSIADDESEYGEGVAYDSRDSRDSRVADE
jgi:hypothetical protein